MQLAGSPMHAGAYQTCTCSLVGQPQPSSACGGGGAGSSCMQAPPSPPLLLLPLPRLGAAAADGAAALAGGPGAAAPAAGAAEGGGAAAPGVHETGPAGAARVARHAAAAAHGMGAGAGGLGRCLVLCGRCSPPAGGLGGEGEGRSLAKRFAHPQPHLHYEQSTCPACLQAACGAALLARRPIRWAFGRLRFDTPG